MTMDPAEIPGGGAQMRDNCVVRASEQPFEEVVGDGAHGLELARLYRHPEGSATFQLARVSPGGISKRHAHEWDQANWVADGVAEVDVDGEVFRLQPGDSIVIPGGRPHSFSNPGPAPLLLVAVLGPGAP
jgi:quercetin dioxygenase-like cupin family protein